MTRRVASRCGRRRSSSARRTGELRIPEGTDNVGLVGTASGSLIGMLIGVLGGPVGVLVGWGAGALMGGVFDIDRAEKSDEALAALGRAIPPESTAVIAGVAEPAVEVIDGEMAKLGGEVTRRPVAEVMDELEAAEEAAEAAAREARRALREKRKAEADRRPRRARGKAEGDAPRLLTTASARRRLSPATGSGGRSTGRQQVMHTASYRRADDRGRGLFAAGEARRTQLEVSVSIRTILLIAGVVAIAWALASIASVLLVIFVSFFSVAVLSPVVSAMERRLRWSRRLSSAVLVLAIVIVLGAVVLVVTQAVVGAVRDFSDDLPRIVDEARQSDLGSFINSGSDSLDTLAQHAGEITSGVAKVSGGVADVGVSAFGVVTLVFSVMFLTLFGLIDEPRLRGWVGGLLYRGDRERFLQVTDRIVQTTSRYMLGNLAISVICGTLYGVTAVILDVPYPLALAVIAGILDLIPSIGATIAGIIVAIAALSVSPAAFVVFLIVMVVYQQIENYILQPTIIGKAARISGFTVLASVLAFGALFGLIGAIIGVPIAAGIQIVVEELTAARRARIAAADAAG